jgi:acyl-CoA thioesterase-1
VQSLSIESSVVIVEIGGNDLLGSTSAAQFERDLEALLAYLAVPGRQIVMFELPLPPFYLEYGRIQRTLARRHYAKLIPRRVFTSVIAGGGSTLDSIHLTQAGHRFMAECVWRVVGPAFGAKARE